MSFLNSAKSIVVPPAPVHVLSTIVLLAFDHLWAIPELGLTMTGVGIPGLVLLGVLLALFCAVSVTLTQHFVANDDWGTSVAKGLALGFIAGLPYQFSGAAAGGILLGWAGINKLLPADDH